MGTGHRYAASAMLIQALTLAGCDGEQGTMNNGATATPVGPTSTATTTAAIARPAGPERLVLAFGDSLYAGYGLKRGEALPDVVQSRLWAAGINATLVNAGVSGDTTAAGRQRLSFALDRLARKPDLVLLGLGGNDLLREIPPAETRANLIAMLDELQRRHIPVLLTGMLAPPNLGPAFRQPFERIWPELALQYHAGLYPFILDGVIGNPALMQGDYVHPNAKGVQTMAERLAPAVEKQLAATPKT